MADPSPARTATAIPAMSLSLAGLQPISVPPSGFPAIPAIPAIPVGSLAVAELRAALLGEGARPLASVLAGEHGHAHLGLERERLVLRHALGLPDDPQDGAHRHRPVG